jgi:hypothetical protein
LRADFYPAFQGFSEILTSVSQLFLELRTLVVFNINLQLIFFTLLGMCCCFHQGCGTSGQDPNADKLITNQENTKAEILYPRIVWKSFSIDDTGIEFTGGPISRTETGLRLLAEKFREINWVDSTKNQSFRLELAEGNYLHIKKAPGETPQIIAAWVQPGPKLANATTSIVRHSDPLKDDSQALTLLEAYLKSNGQDFESLLNWKSAPADFK